MKVSPFFSTFPILYLVESTSYFLKREEVLIANKASLKTVVSAKYSLVEAEIVTLVVVTFFVETVVVILVVVVLEFTFWILAVIITAITKAKKAANIIIPVFVFICIILLYVLVVGHL